MPQSWQNMPKTALSRPRKGGKEEDDEPSRETRIGPQYQVA